MTQDMLDMPLPQQDDELPDAVPVPGADPDRRLLMLHAGSFIAYARQSYRRYCSWISAATILALPRRFSMRTRFAESA